MEKSSGPGKGLSLGNVYGDDDASVGQSVSMGMLLDYSSDDDSDGVLDKSQSPGFKDKELVKDNNQALDKKGEESNKSRKEESQTPYIPKPNQGDENEKESLIAEYNNEKKIKKFSYFDPYSFVQLHLIPPEPMSEVDPDLLFKIETFHKKRGEGVFFNNYVMETREIQNPYVIDQLLKRFNCSELHQISSNYPSCVFDPNDFDISDHYSKLLENQWQLKLRKQQEMKQREAVQFQNAGVLPSIIPNSLNSFHDNSTNVETVREAVNKAVDKKKRKSKWGPVAGKSDVANFEIRANSSQSIEQDHDRKNGISEQKNSKERKRKGGNRSRSSSIDRGTKKR